MVLTPELQTLVDALQHEKIVVLLAPSFPVDFIYPDIILDLKMISVEKTVELTYAAKLINMEYEKILKENPDKRYICPNCPTVVKMIEFKYPELKEFIIDVASPMIIMDRFVKKEYGPDHKTLFIGPCLAKKMEAKEYEINYAITFKELQDIFIHNKENNITPKEFTYSVTEDGTPDFDKFYNDYTKVYPLTGGVADSLHVKGIIDKSQILVVDGPTHLDAGFQEFKNNPNIKFLDILACEGGCIGGPGMISKEPLEVRKQKVLDYKHYCKKDKIGSKLGKFEYADGLNLTRK
ncbi:MAG: [Fe-Fe] hydrogenase large subunit C-terminal domain-containing protein [Candidatus Absconditabacterales bacterium]